MNEVIEFLHKVRIFYLATNDAGQPRVRPMGAVMEYDGKPTFCTANTKPMFAQMKANPRVEFCACDAQWNTLRIKGSVAFITSEASQKAVLEAMPGLANMYSVNDGKFEIFTLCDATALFMDAKGSVREIRL